MCTDQKLQQALTDYLAEKTAEKLAALQQIICDLKEEGRWVAITEIATGDNAGLKMALAEAIVTTRPATEEEAELWHNIDGNVMPVFGDLSDNYGDESQCAAVARLIVDFYNGADEDQQALIIEVLEAASDENGFFGGDDNPESEAGIYKSILTDDDEPESTDETQIGSGSDE